ncbi:MAG: Glu-tRNA(Gln) amidotransferase GatDE subunit D, partial [archaeon]
DLNVYRAGRKMLDAGVVPLGDMLPETAYVKLGWVLGHKGWDAKEMMLKNFAGEIKERSDAESFLY